MAEPPVADPVVDAPAADPAEAHELDRAHALLAQAASLDPATVVPEVSVARYDLEKTLTTYVTQQAASVANPLSASVLGASSARTPSGAPAPSGSTLTPTGPTPSTDPTALPTTDPTAAPAAHPTADPSVVPHGPQEPSDPQDSVDVASADAAAPSASPGPVLPQADVAAPDGGTPEEVAAGTAALGIVRLVDVVAAADRLALLLNITIDVSQSSVPPTAQGTTLTDQLTQVVAQYGHSIDQYENGRIPASALCALNFAPGHALRCDAAERMNALAAEFEKAFGHKLAITDSYRSIETQIALKAIKPVLAAVPGTSEHGWGLAVDLGGTVPSGTSAEYVWLRSHAPDFGWDNPTWARPSGSKPEPWHFEFFGGGAMPTRYTPAEQLGGATAQQTTPAPVAGGSAGAATQTPATPNAGAATPAPGTATPTPAGTPAPSQSSTAQPTPPVEQPAPPAEQPSQPSTVQPAPPAEQPAPPAEQPSQPPTVDPSPPVEEPSSAPAPSDPAAVNPTEPAATDSPTDNTDGGERGHGRGQHRWGG